MSYEPNVRWMQHTRRSSRIDLFSSLELSHVLPIPSTNVDAVPERVDEMLRAYEGAGWLPALRKVACK